MTGYHVHREYVRSNVSAQSLPFGVGSGMSALLSNVRARPLGDSRTLQSRLGFLEGVEHVVIRLDNAAQHPIIRAILGFTTTATTIEANARTWLEFPRCLVDVNTLGNERAIF